MIAANFADENVAVLVRVIGGILLLITVIYSVTAICEGLSDSIRNRRQADVMMGQIRRYWEAKNK